VGEAAPAVPACTVPDSTMRTTRTVSRATGVGALRSGFPGKDARGLLIGAGTAAGGRAGSRVTRSGGSGGGGGWIGAARAGCGS
jgi:hypothetical protein